MLGVLNEQFAINSSANNWIRVCDLEVDRKEEREMKFLEELKAAQAILGRFDVPPLDCVLDDAFFDLDELDSLAAVLRRIPQLIQITEWIESVSNRTDGEFGASQTLNAYQFALEIRRLLSKASSDAERSDTLEGGK